MKLPVEECFHDYELLLPVHLLERFAKEAGCSVRALLALCSPANAEQVWQRQLALLQRQSQKRQDGRAEKEKKEKKEGAATAAENASAGSPPVLRAPVLRPMQAEARSTAPMPPRPSSPSVSLILNPAVSSSTPNPHRTMKNKRIDIIDEAAMRYHYQRLTQRRGGGEAALGGRGEGGDIRTSLQAQLSRTGATVIDPAQWERHHIVHGEAAAAGSSPRWLPAHRQTKSLERVASERASFARFLSDSFIGLDIQVMALSGAVVGYYAGLLRGAPKETCLTYAMVGLVVMMLVDAVLLLIRLGREDEATRKERKRIARQRAALLTPKEGGNAAADPTLSAAATAAEMVSWREKLLQELHGSVLSSSSAEEKKRQ